VENSNMVMAPTPLPAAALQNEPDDTVSCAATRLEALTFDPEQYRGFVQDCDLTEAQQIEFLQTMWSIMVAIVDLGFGFNPLQHIIEKVLDADSDRVLESRDISDKRISTADAFNASAQEMDS